MTDPDISMVLHMLVSDGLFSAMKLNFPRISDLNFTILEVRPPLEKPDMEELRKLIPSTFRDLEIKLSLNILILFGLDLKDIKVS